MASKEEVRRQRTTERLGICNHCSAAGVCALCSNCDVHCRCQKLLPFTDAQLNIEEEGKPDA